MAGSDVNIVYPEDSHRKKIHKKGQDGKAKEEDEEEYKCSLLINYIRHNHLSSEDMVLTMSYLISKGAKLDLLDSKGMDALVYAVRQNYSGIAQFLLDNRRYHENNLDLDFQDP